MPYGWKYKKTLTTLQKMAEAHAASRDALVEFSIQRLKPVIEQEKRKLDLRQKLAQLSLKILIPMV